MKFAVFAILAGSAMAFTPPAMTFAVGKKASAPKAKTVAVKKAAPVKKAAVKQVAAAKKVVAKKAAPIKKAVVKKAAPVVKKAAPVVKKAVKKAAPVVKKAVQVVKAAPKPKKVFVKKAAPKPRIAQSSSVATIPSLAIPYESAPALLDGSLIGDVGFDPCYLSTKADSSAAYFNGLFGGNAPTDGLTWYREAELMHGRICQVAVVGFIAPGFGTISGNEWTDSFGYTNPLEALSSAPSASLFQIFAFMSILELRRVSIILEDGPGYQAGDAQRWGQGEGRFNPFGFNYTPAEYEEKQLQEIKHSRLAMIGLLGLIFQANASGVSVVDQLSSAFVYPEYVAKVGYFFPEGI